MTIETKFDLGQQVFFAKQQPREIVPVKILEIRVSVDHDIMNGEPFICLIYRINYDCIWVGERDIFATHEDASDQLAKWVEYEVRRDSGR